MNEQASPPVNSNPSDQPAIPDLAQTLTARTEWVQRALSPWARRWLPATTVGSTTLPDRPRPVTLTTSMTTSFLGHVQRASEVAALWRIDTNALQPVQLDRFGAGVVDRFPDISRRFELQPTPAQTIPTDLVLAGVDEAEAAQAAPEQPGKYPPLSFAELQAALAAANQGEAKSTIPQPPGATPPTTQPVQRSTPPVTAQAAPEQSGKYPSLSFAELEAALAAAKQREAKSTTPAAPQSPGAAPATSQPPQLPPPRSTPPPQIQRLLQAAQSSRQLPPGTRPRSKIEEVTPAAEPRPKREPVEDPVPPVEQPATPFDVSGDGPDQPELGAEMSQPAESSPVQRQPESEVPPGESPSSQIQRGPDIPPGQPSRPRPASAQPGSAEHPSLPPKQVEAVKSHPVSLPASQPSSPPLQRSAEQDLPPIDPKEKGKQFPPLSESEAEPVPQDRIEPGSTQLDLAPVEGTGIALPSESPKRPEQRLSLPSEPGQGVKPPIQRLAEPEPARPVGFEPSSPAMSPPGPSIEPVTTSSAEPEQLATKLPPFEREQSKPGELTRQKPSGPPTVQPEIRPESTPLQRKQTSSTTNQADELAHSVPSFPSAPRPTGQEPVEMDVPLVKQDQPNLPLRPADTPEPRPAEPGPPPSLPVQRSMDQGLEQPPVGHEEVSAVLKADTGEPRPAEPGAIPSSAVQRATEPELTLRELPVIEPEQPEREGEPASPISPSLREQQPSIPTAGQKSTSGLTLPPDESEAAPSVSRDVLLQSYQEIPPADLPQRLEGDTVPGGDQARENSARFAAPPASPVQRFEEPELTLREKPPVGGPSDPPPGPTPPSEQLPPLLPLEASHRERPVEPLSPSPASPSVQRKQTGSTTNQADELAHSVPSFPSAPRPTGQEPVEMDVPLVKRDQPNLPLRPADTPEPRPAEPGPPPSLPVQRSMDQGLEQPPVGHEEVSAVLKADTGESRPVEPGAIPSSAVQRATEPELTLRELPTVEPEQPGREGEPASPIPPSLWEQQPSIPPAGQKSTSGLTLPPNESEAAPSVSRDVLLHPHQEIPPADLPQRLEGDMVPGGDQARENSAGFAAPPASPVQRFEEPELTLREKPPVGLPPNLPPDQTPSSERLPPSPSGVGWPEALTERPAEPATRPEQASPPVQRAQTGSPASQADKVGPSILPFPLTTELPEQELGPSELPVRLGGRSEPGPSEPGPTSSLPVQRSPERDLEQPAVGQEETASEVTPGEKGSTSASGLNRVSEPAVQRSPELEGEMPLRIQPDKPPSRGEAEKPGGLDRDLLARATASAHLSLFERGREANLAGQGKVVQTRPLLPIATLPQARGQTAPAEINEVVAWPDEPVLPSAFRPQPATPAGERSPLPLAPPVRIEVRPEKAAPSEVIPSQPSASSSVSQVQRQLADQPAPAQRVEGRAADSAAAVIQREEKEGTAASEQPQKEPVEAPELDKLARQIYPLIKRMLAVERERRPIR